ncbi:hypothetical protein SPBR_06823 [Sporothrix brasiliensis 5110]|uniref:Uncharacterized protein n=1 Tax=Sporothrix brasiliensis 5110 TaxID=1398154 RepID=A0A0C2IWB8_9PEZI|nr:uncharacterized protein SPBR_06823 [Sporothrix brasiliensis 5110]KIH89287.1 hypothetical protein SPBR_06823 [Sporothrix brasiliensis 5110]
MSAGSAATDQGRTPSTPSSPHMRLDATTSTSPTVTTVTSGSAGAATVAESTGDAQPYIAGDEVSPTFAAQAIFSVKDGSDLGGIRRPSRRRTGPLSASQREKAALIRKLGACIDCRRRRVACHPNHHNMTWEDAVRKYKSHSPTQEYSPLAGRPISPARGGRVSFGQSDAQDMEIDTTPTPTTPHRMAEQQHQSPPQSQLPQQRNVQHQPPHSRTLLQAQAKPHPIPLPPPISRRLSVGTEARLRTPLPSGPSGRSLEKLASAALPGIESLSGDLQNAAARIINSTNPSRTRYDAVQVMILVWSNDTDYEVRDAIDDLAELFEKKYNYSVDIKAIPVGAQSPYRWLLHTASQFINNRDSRDTLKIVYYVGHTYLDVELSTQTTTIRWSGIQQVLEDATSDTLMIMDAAFYPCSKMARREGVFELVAASAGEDPKRALGRVAFTRALIDELSTRLNQKFRGPLSAFSAAELHVRLMSNYPRIIEDRNPDKERLTSFPAPLHILITSDARLPSILLAPSRKPLPTSPEATTPGTQLNLTLRLVDGAVDKPGWIEWMRLLPEGVREVKCESPYRNAFR